MAKMFDTKITIFPVDVQAFIQRGQSIDWIFSQICPGSLKMSRAFVCKNYSSNAAMMPKRCVVGLCAHRYAAMYCVNDCKIDTHVQSRWHQLQTKGI